jgi:class 3 adenylate cyclase
MWLSELFGAVAPEPITDDAYRKFARGMVLVHALLFALNGLSGFLAPYDPTISMTAVREWLAVNLTAHAAAMAVNLWWVQRAVGERALRTATLTAMSFTQLTTVSSLWVNGAVTSWNYVWLVLAVLVYRIYFDLRIGRAVLAMGYLQFFVLVALEVCGVLPHHPLRPASVWPEYQSAFFEVYTAGWIAILCLTGYIGGNYAANRMRKSEHALTELNRTLEERVQRQVGELERTNRLRRYLAPQVVNRLLHADVDPVAVRERRPVTVLFADLKGFTPMTERLEPEVLAAVLTRYFEEVAEIAFRHGGTIDKFIGDAVMVFFGAPEATGEADQALRCVQLALEVQRRVTELGDEFVRLGAGEPLKLRIGIGSGLATVGEFGARHRTDFTAVGVPVNRAARLEPLAPVGGVLVDAGTRALILERAVMTPFGEPTLKGFSQPQPAFLVEKLN